MDFGIKGKRAFVSGSSQGIGRAIALALAGEGVDVAVHGRDRPRTEHVAREVEALGVRAVATLGDLATAEGCEAVARETLAAFGGLDILVNNTGVALLKHDPVWSDIPDETWHDSFDVNIMSTLRMSRHFLAALKENGWGRIVNISTGGATGTPVLTEYGAAKAALNKLSADMAKDLGQYGITVNSVAPGVIRSAATETWIEIQSKERGISVDDFEQAWLAENGNQAIHRFGAPEDIANAAVFFASRQAKHITGTILNVNGGGNRTVYM
ncbi:MAG TPA: SDR family oxidoreductase [Novosphingobium sp.]|nr:SDR family oxidoreductase [Novosphingobium sp.]